MEWYELYTRHHHERAVHNMVLDKSFQSYLPFTMVWRHSNRGPRKMATPLFPRRVFIRCYLEMYTHLELISVPGVMRILEDTQGRLLVVPEDEVRLFRKLCDADICRDRSGYQPSRKLVKVVQGQLRGISGVMREGTQSTLLVPIHTLQTSVVVEVNRAQLMPCADSDEESRPRPLTARLMVNW
jgi:transcription antitermination factor NusG